MLRILYNDRLLDINPDQTFTLSFQGADLTQLGVRSDAFSDTWELPTTANNRDAFGLIDNPQGSLDAAYTSASCLIYQDNTILLVGVGRVVGCDINTIRLEVSGSIGGFIDTVGAKLTTELELDIEYLWDSVQLNNGIEYDTGLVQYALCDNGYLTNLQVQGTTNSICEGFRPWFKYGLLVKVIFEQNGYTVNMPTGAAFDNIFITGGIRHHDATFIANGATELLLAFSAYGTGTNTRITPTVVKAGYWDNTAKEYNYQGGCYVNIDISFEVEVNGPTLQATPAQLFIESNNGRVYTEYNFPLLTTSIYQATITRSFTLWMEPFDELYFRVVTNGFTSMDFGGADAEKNYLRITPVDLNPPLAAITARCLPELPVVNLLADFCNRFGLFIRINETTRQVSFDRITNLQLTPLKDWSDKVVTPIKSLAPTQYRTEFTYGSLAQNNWFRNRNNVGDGKFVSQINAAELEQDAFQSDVELGSISTIHQNLITSPVYAVFTQKGGDVSPYFVGGNYPFGRIAVYDGMLFKSLRDGTKFLPPRGGVTNAINTNTGWLNIKFSDIYDWRYDGFTCAWFDLVDLPAEQYPSGMTVLWPLGNTTNIDRVHYPNFEKVYWQPLLDAYQSVIQSIIQKPRVDKVLVKLDISDLTNFDFSRAVTINGVKYYVNLIDQFNAVTNEPVVCELVRIP